MDIKNQIKTELENLLPKLGINEAVSFDILNTKDKKFGDYSTNLGMKLTKILKANPLQIGEKIKNLLSESKLFSKIEIQGPGFINFFVNENDLSDIVKAIINDPNNFGRGDKKDKRINIEFVSANPTGKLHLGHARIAAIGDSLNNVLCYLGYQCKKEYYVNDCGNQIENLGLSVYARYLELFGKEFSIPEDGYQGKDIINVAKFLKEKYDQKFIEKYEENKQLIIRESINFELEIIKKDLKDFGVVFDIFAFESDIRNKKDYSLSKLIFDLKPYTYEKDGATFLKTTDFFDDKDRPIIKSDGTYTYFAPDISYHLNKFNRGFDEIIDILGSDHHGYINRMKSAIKMKGFNEQDLKVIFVQVVRLMDGDVEIKMSKRTGNALTLQELMEEVGKDAMRYFFLSRTASGHLDFDFNLAKDTSSKNPVYYVKYAHARLSKILRDATTKQLDFSKKSEVEYKKESEKRILKDLNSFKEILSKIENTYDVSLLINYVFKLSTDVHFFYNDVVIFDENNLETTVSRLRLVNASKIILKKCLDLLGVEAPEHM